MPGNFSDYLEQNILNITLRVVPMPVPGNIFVALFTANPTDANIKKPANWCGLFSEMHAEGAEIAANYPIMPAWQPSCDGP